MTRLLEPYRVEHTIRVTHIARSAALPGVWVLRTSQGAYYSRGVPRVLSAMLQAHGAIAVKIRRFEDTPHIETILSIQKAR